MTSPDEEPGDKETELGFQDRKRALCLRQEQGDGSTHYGFEVEARCDPGSGKPRSYGAFVHGPSATPFLYLILKRTRAADSPWIRRLKIPLAALI